MTTFNNRQDVLDFYGAKDEAHMSQRVYKFTECGAWAKFDTEFVKTGTKVTTYTALLQKGINGVYVHNIVEGASTSFDPSPEGFPGIPDDAKAFLALDTTKGKANRSLLSPEEFDKLATDYSTFVNLISPIQKGVTFTTTADTGDTKEGLRIGSIVEGSDAECTPHFLPFPFTGEDLDNAIQQIEEQATELWNEANGEDE